MITGDLVQWSWALKGDSWDRTPFTGIILGTRLVKTDMEKVLLYDVLVNDGLISEIREDDPTLELINETR